MSKSLEPDYLTEKHYAALGRVLHSFSRVEALIDQAITELLKLQEWQAAFAFAQSGYEQKNKLIRTLIGESVAPAHQRKQCIDILDKIGKKSVLRNNVAHSIWKKGRKPDSIKPMVLKVKAKLLLLGLDHNEKEWTPKQLDQEADELLELGFALGQSFGLDFFNTENGAY